MAQRDIDSLAQQLKETLSQNMEHAFSTAPSEEIFLTHCSFTIASNHKIGEEAAEVRVTVSYTCKATAIDSPSLQAQTIQAFTSQTNPGTHYIRVGTIQASVVSVSPFLVRVSGMWAYNLTPSYQHELVRQIAGDTPKLAIAYLLHTNGIQQVVITTDTTLPQDPDYIHFRIFL